MSCKTCGSRGPCTHNNLISNLQRLVDALEAGKYNAKPSKLVQGSCHCTDPRCEWEGHRK